MIATLHPFKHINNDKQLLRNQLFSKNIFQWRLFVSMWIIKNQQFMRKFLKYVLIAASLLIMSITAQAGNHSPPAFKPDHDIVCLDQVVFQDITVYEIHYNVTEQDSVTRSWLPMNDEVVKFKKICRGYFHPLRE
jgi:hypothetical protein